MSNTPFAQLNTSTQTKGVEPVAWSPVDRLSLLALRHSLWSQGRLFSQAEVSEITARREDFRRVERFFGLDIHREYLVATAVDRDLRVVYGPTRLTWDRFEDWIARTLTPRDAVVVEMTTNTWAVHDALVNHVHSVTVVHPPHVKLTPHLRWVQVSPSRR
jgi:hypothetical protein